MAVGFLVYVYVTTYLDRCRRDPNLNHLDDQDPDPCHRRRTYQAKNDHANLLKLKEVFNYCNKWRTSAANLLSLHTICFQNQIQCI